MSIRINIIIENLLLGYAITKQPVVDGKKRNSVRCIQFEECLKVTTTRYALGYKPFGYHGFMTV